MHCLWGFGTYESTVEGIALNCSRILLGVVSFACITALAEPVPMANTYRLYHGVTAYVNNPTGQTFELTLDLRDINIYANGPREVLFKVYDPEGKAVVREIIPDDGIVAKSFMPRIGGWDHELEYYALCYATGTSPMLRFSTWSDPGRLGAVAKRTFTRTIRGKKGIYRIVLAGARDHYATLKLEPSLPLAVTGHHTFLYGHGSQFNKSFIYVPRGTTGIHLAIAEPDVPRSRRFTLTDPAGKKLFEGAATGSFFETTVKLAKPGQYDDQVLTMSVSEGPGDFLLHAVLQRARKAYMGMGVAALLAPDEETASALRGGAIYADGEVFWHPFQVRFHRWLGKNQADTKLDAQLRGLAGRLRLLDPSDGRGSKGFTNWAYAFGYYGCKVWRPGWLLMQRDDVPGEVKDIIREAFIIGGDRLSFALGVERVNGNAFAQIPVALWYCHQATGDSLQKERFNTWFERWRSEGWGEGAGISRSGDSQEHFGHDMAYGAYIMNNWGGPGTWVKPGILEDTDEPRFREVHDRVRNLYTYLYCADANGKPVPANPWSSRTHQTIGKWQDMPWKANPGPDLTVSVNGGDEWFAARRKSYYALTFHGRLAPAWLVNTFHGQVGFGGGILCQLTVPGRGAVLASTLKASYGKGMHLSKWRDFHIHSVVGEMWDGVPFVAAVSEHANAKLEGNVVASSGEVRGRPLRVARRYAFNAESIDCEVKLSPTEYVSVLSMWSRGRPLAHVKEAWEMIPYLKGKVTFTDAAGQPAGELTESPAATQTIVIDRGGYGVRLELEKPMPVRLGKSTVLIQLAAPGAKPIPAETIALKYRLSTFGSEE